MVTWRRLRSLRPPSTPDDHEPGSGILATRCVLLVEADDPIAEAVQALSAAESAPELVRVRSCAEACEAAVHRRFALAVLALRPPGGSGVELAARLIHLERARSVVFLAGRESSAAERLSAITVGPLITPDTPAETLQNLIFAACAERLRRSSRF